MDREWLSPSINKRVNEIIEQYELDHSEQNRRFSKVMNEIRCNLPEDIHQHLNEIEDLYIDRTLDVRSIYKAGVIDILKVLNVEMRV